MQKNRLAAAIIGCGAALSVPSMAQAQSNNDTALEEVLVMAQKREQRVEEIPQSLQLMDADMLVNSSIRDIGELITFVPGASEGLGVSLGQRRFQIRGIYQESGSATIGYYLDEAPIDGDTAAPIGRVYDMQQVEILRGPQSTLYGNGAMGGVMRYVPNLPDLAEVRGGFRVGYSDTADGESGNYTDAFISIPLIEDELGIRLVGSREKVGGYADVFMGDQDINGGDLRDLRAHVLWTPSEDWSLRFTYSDSQADQDGGGMLLSGEFPNDTISTSGSESDFNNNNLEVISGTLEFSGWKFAELVTTFSQVEYTNESLLFLELPGLSAVTAVSDTSIDTFSNETRLVSTGEGGLQWVVGVYYTDTDTERNSVTTWDPEIPPFFVSSELTTNDERDSLAFFGEVSFELMDGKLIPLFGVRWSEESFDGDTPAAAGVPGGAEFDNTNFRFNLSYMPSENAHYYLNIAEGFRSGVFNDVNICGVAHNLLLVEGECELVQETDELISYEIGAKLTLADQQVWLESALYLIDWQRTPQQLPIGGLFQTYNVGDSEITGIDLSVIYRPQNIANLEFSLTANWLDAEFSDVASLVSASLVPPFTPVPVGAREGEALPFVPEWTSTLAVNYAWDFIGDWNGMLNLSWNHLDGQFGQFGANTERGDSRDLVRARIGVQNDTFGIFLFGRNLTDEDGTIFNQAPTGGVRVFTRDYPRQLGVELSYNFN